MFDKLKIKFTRYQLGLLFGIILYSYPLFASNQLFSVFANIQPKWRCDDGSNSSSSFSNDCNVLQNCSAAAGGRHGNNLKFEIEFESMVSELQLYCSKSHIGPLIASLQMSGLIVGSIIWGQFCDFFGRKPTMILCYTGLFTFSTLSTLFYHWEIIATMRFFCGLTLGGMIISNLPAIMESIQPNQRMFLRAIFGWWGQGRLIYALIAMATKYWRYTYRIINCICLGILPIIIFFFQESPRWLIQRNKYEEAKKRLRKIAKINKRKKTTTTTTINNNSNNNDDNQFELIDEMIRNENKDQQQLYTFRDLFSTAELRKRALLMGYLYFACACVSYGMDLRSGRLAGNLYVNQILIGVAISLTKPMILLVDTYWPNFNRRLLHQTSMIVTLLCLISITVLINFSGRVPEFAVNTISIIGILILEYQWDAVYLYASELFPTACRSIGMSFAAILGRIGSTCAPQFVYLSEFWTPAAYIIFTCIGMISVVLSCLFLPDTKNQELPDTLALKTVTILKNDKHYVKKEEIELLPTKNSSDESNIYSARENLNINKHDLNK